MQTAEKKGFSLMGLIFGAYYYVGYGKLKKGLILGAISSFPLFAVFINIYLGFKAKKELPIGEVAFNWKNIFILFIIQLVLASILFSMSPLGQKEAILSDVSGVWESSASEKVVINLIDSKKSIDIEGQNFPVTIKEINFEKHIVKVNVGKEYWVVQQKFADDGKFTLLIRLHTGKIDELSYVKEL